ncbi:sister chromatid cohesion protein Dcc1 [Entophlyctis helioformis]|nr:sister chromatid cohesion protein Dcc1 [Entophlyctis helioformis]
MSSSKSRQKQQQHHQYKVLECPPELVARLESAKSLVIRGDADDAAVLCTDTETYSIRLVQTSNTMVIIQPRPPALGSATTEHDQLVAPSGQPYQLSSAFRTRFPDTASVARSSEIIDTVSSYMELTRVRPKFDRLAAMLAERPYIDADLDERQMRSSGSFGLHTMASILDTVQASEHEIRKELESMTAFEMDGFWRTLAPTAALQVLSHIFVATMDEDLDFSSMSFGTLLECLKDDGIPTPVLECCLKLFSESHRRDESGDLLFKISFGKVARLYGEQVLAALPSAGSDLVEFLRSWRAQTPASIDIHLDQIKGLYLIEGNSAAAQTIKYFPKSVLPSDPKTRFEDLFKIRQKWAREDIVPYIEDLASSDKDRDLLFLKYARTSKTGTRTFFTSRFTSFER